jgi:hypothetical protein
LGNHHGSIDLLELSAWIFLPSHMYSGGRGISSFGNSLDCCRGVEEGSNLDSGRFTPTGMVGDEATQGEAT